MKPVKRSQHHAFTLLEIMLVVAIIALLLSTGFYFLGPQILAGQDAKIMADFRVFDTGLQAYENFGGAPPSTDQGLQALVTMPEGEPKPMRWYQQLKQLPKDPGGVITFTFIPGCTIRRVTIFHPRAKTASWAPPTTRIIGTRISSNSDPANVKRSTTK